MPALIYPLLVMLVLPLGGIAYWLPVAFNIVLVPLLDECMRVIAPGWKPGPRLQQFCFAMPWFWLYALTQLVVLVSALLIVSRQPLSVFEFFGLVSSVGIMTGTAGITAAHELIHRRSGAERALGLVLLGMTSFMHFRIEHVYGHHRHVGTVADPASAALGESFPAFFAKGLWRGVRSAWFIERAQRERRGLPGVSLGNRMVQYLIMQAAVYGLILVTLGAGTALFFLLQSLMAVHLLEAVNYVQHYGLRRGTMDGRFERITAAHSWDADDAISGLLIFNLSHHADHHQQPARAASMLSVAEQAPRLPYSFFLMVFLALIPPLWHRLMDRRVQALSGVVRGESVGSPRRILPATGG